MKIQTHSKLFVALALFGLGLSSTRAEAADRPPACPESVLAETSSRYLKSAWFQNPATAGQYTENICMVAFIEDTGTCRNMGSSACPAHFVLRVKKLNDSYYRWSKVGEDVGTLPPSDGSFDFLVDGKGVPFVAWVLEGPRGSVVNVGRWDGTQWSLAAANAEMQTTAYDPSLRVESDGSVSVAWVELGTDGVSRTLKRRFTGSDWVLVP